MVVDQPVDAGEVIDLSSVTLIPKPAGLPDDVFPTDIGEVATRIAAVPMSPGHIVGEWDLQYIGGRKSSSNMTIAVPSQSIPADLRAPCLVGVHVDGSADSPLLTRWHWDSGWAVTFGVDPDASNPVPGPAGDFDQLGLRRPFA
ncbi:SAF domain-containing protein [Gordonia sp. (in: high G+C Gram-positive bacteria)]|uniref:SAF domain-containing protein n=1 Tax=Gordonia sp. (in: high G+C Gram-positive bacteria) TaxID=84139 RepID=UPI003BB50522